MKLASASGFQSARFREIEFLSGLKDPSSMDGFRGLAAPDEDRLRPRLEEPSRPGRCGGPGTYSWPSDMGRAHL